MRFDCDPLSLRQFLAVCEEGSIVRAAEREATVASAVSKRVAALEEQFRLPLLRRGPKGMVPTEAGEALAAQAREVEISMERLRTRMRDLASGGAGTVRIVAGLAALSNTLPQDLVRVLARHRAIQVSLREAVSSEIVRQVREGSADLGVCWDAIDLSGLETVPYFSDHACLLVHRSHALARRQSVRFEETLDCNYISAMPGSMMETMLRRHAAMAGKQLAPKIEMQSFDGVSRTVAAGLGVAVLPREVVSAVAESLGVRMIPLADDWARRQFVICFRATPYASASALLVMEGLRS